MADTVSNTPELQNNAAQNDNDPNMQSMQQLTEMVKQINEAVTSLVSRVTGIGNLAQKVSDSVSDQVSNLADKATNLFKGSDDKKSDKKEKEDDNQDTFNPSNLSALKDSIMPSAPMMAGGKGSSNDNNPLNTFTSMAQNSNQQQPGGGQFMPGGGSGLGQAAQVVEKNPELIAAAI